MSMSTEDADRDGHHLFLSYSRNDERLVRELARYVEANGWRAWVDRKSIPSASEWMTEIRLGIESADAFVFVLTPHSLASRMCRVELSIATDLSKRLLPLRPLTHDAWAEAERHVRDHLDADYDGKVPAELAQLDYIDLADFADSSNPLEALVGELIEAAARDLDWVRLHTRLQRDAKRWVDGRYSAAALLRGSLLAAVEAMLDAQDKEPPLSDLQREYVVESRAEHQRHLEREADKLARRILDLDDIRVATGVMLAIEGLDLFTGTPLLSGALRTLLSRWPQHWQIGHGDAVTSAVFSADGKCILTASLDGYARLIDRTTGAILRSAGQAGVPIWKAALSADGKRVFAGCGDGRLCIFDLDTNEVSAIAVGASAVRNLAVSEDEELIAAAADNEAVVVELASKRTWRHDYPDKIRDVFVRQGRVITSCHDGKVRFFDPAASTVATYPGEDEAINRIVLSPGTNWMAVCGPFHHIAIVDLESRKEIRRLDADESGLLMASSVDGRYLASTDIWGHVFTYDTLEGRRLQKKHLFEHPVQEVTVSDDGSLLAATSGSGVSVVTKVSGEGQWLCSGHDGRIVQLAFAPAGDFLVSAGADGTARLFGVGRLPRCVTLRHPDAVLHMDFSPDSGSIATTARDGSARVFLLSTGEQVGEFPTVPDDLLSASFIADDRLVLACKAGRITIVDVAATNEPLLPDRRHLQRRRRWRRARQR
jgi:WD40 repeat protein